MTALSQYILIVGLGNPGPQYHKTRHNIGFSAVDVLARQLNLVSFNENSKFSAFITQAIVDNCKIILAKPNTYMNLSGQAIQKIKHYYKIDNINIIVIHDDIDLKFGQVKIKFGGGHAGHNGLKSIDNIIGKDYWRLRLGVDRPIDNRILVADYVLSPFTNTELSQIDILLATISQNIHHLLAADRHSLMQHL